MRSQPMSNQEYDQLTKDSKGFSVQGSVAEFKDKNGFRQKALRVANGMLFCFSHLRLCAGDHYYSCLPVGTRVTIDICPGITPPFNRFAEHPIKFQVESDDGVEWIDD